MATVGGSSLLSQQRLEEHLRCHGATFDVVFFNDVGERMCMYYDIYIIYILGVSIKNIHIYIYIYKLVQGSLEGEMILELYTCCHEI